MIPWYCIAHPYCPGTVLASLACARERVHVQKVRDFPQTKLDNEINAPLLLNEHGDPHFLFHNFKTFQRAQHRMSKLCFHERIIECRVFEDILSIKESKKVKLHVM